MMNRTVSRGSELSKNISGLICILFWFGKHQVNDASSKLMYLRAQPSSHVSLVEERMVVGGRKGQGVTQYSQNLSMTFFVLLNSVCLILPSLSWELICTLQAY